MLISILSFSGIITSTLSYTQDDVAHGLQNFLVCIEMLFAAIAHRLYFSAQVRLCGLLQCKASFSHTSAAIFPTLTTSSSSSSSSSPSTHWLLSLGHPILWVGAALPAL